LFPVGTSTVTYTFSDTHGNSSTCTFHVTVTDNTPPAISGCPSDITVVTGPGRTSCDQTASWTAPTASDNCGGTVTVSTNHSPGSLFSKGTTTVTYTFTDSHGNSSTCSFKVIVVDNTVPVITCPATQTVDCQASTAPANTGMATATDN